MHLYIMETLGTSHTLNSGHTCPLLGLGTVSVKAVDEVVYNSIKDGTRMIDTADAYGNEVEIGRGIARAINEGLVKREDLFIITKLNARERDDPEAQIKKSIEKLGLTYIDLYLDHWPLFIQYKNGEMVKNAPLHVTWRKMESFVEQGLTRSIGVSNYNVQSLCNLLSFCTIKPSFLEVEFHPYLYQKNLLEFCRSQNIKVLAYNPMVKGSYCKQYHSQEPSDLLNETIIKELSEKYQKTPGQIVLNWSVCLGAIPIPSTSNVNRMKENIIACQFKMSDDDVNRISALNKNYRFCPSTNWPATFAWIDLHA